VLQSQQHPDTRDVIAQELVTANTARKGSLALLARRDDGQPVVPYSGFLHGRRSQGRRAAGRQLYLVVSRVPQPSIVREFWDDQPPEAIRQHSR
jgi:hypothetical protein